MHLRTFAQYCATFPTVYILVINKKRHGITDNMESSGLEIVSL
jgi:hypothetical protein